MKRAAKERTEELYNDELDEVYQSSVPKKRKRVSSSSDFLKNSPSPKAQEKKRGRPPKAAKVANKEVIEEEDP